MSAPAVARPSPAYWQAVEELQENPGQWQAYNSDGHCVVLAGPGSGKTRTLTVKIAKLLIETIHEPRGLACITYNSECARELKARLERLGVYESRSVFIGTVHSFCLRRVVIPFSALAGIELPEDFRIALESEQEAAFEEVRARVSPDGRSRGLRTMAEKYRRTHLDRDGAEWQEDKELAALVAGYEQLLRAGGMIDFDDMVLIGLKLIESRKWVRRALHAQFPVVVVDEYQDLGLALHRIVSNLCFRGGSRLFAVGDPDQSIYGFAGARPELFRGLADSPEVEAVQLPFNYRSGETIVQAAEIALGETRGYEARGANAGSVDFHERPRGLDDQAEYICGEIIPSAMERVEGLQLADVAVLYVDRSDGDVIAGRAKQHKYATVRVDRGAPYRKTPLIRWLEDCSAWCAGGWATGSPRLSSLLGTCASILGMHAGDREWHEHKVRLVGVLLSQRQPELLLREWLTTLKREVLDLFLERDMTLRDEREALGVVTEACKIGGVLGEWSVAAFGGQGGSPDHLNLITLWSAKGHEYRVVVMMGMEEGRVPGWNASELEKREQRRLFYVGLTRAKEEVHMTYSGWRENRYGRRFFDGPSRFLVEVRERL